MVFEEAAGLVPVRLLHQGASVAGVELTVPEAFSRKGRFYWTAISARSRGSVQ